MKEKFQRFMQGRYGSNGGDELSRFLLVVCMVLIIAKLFVKWRVLSLLIGVVLVYAYYRLFSRDYARRYGENQKFLGLKNKYKYLWEQHKNYHIYHCPSCKQKIRVPRGKGKIVVTCPKCRTEFQKKS